MIRRLSSRLGLAALLGGALVVGGDTAQARPGHGGGGHGGGGHGGGGHGGYSHGGYGGGARPGGAAFVRPGGAAFVRPGGAAFVRPGGAVVTRPYYGYGGYRPYYGYGLGYGRGFYRPYYGYGLGGFGLGLGLGYGLGYGLGGYGLGGYGGYAPYYGGGYGGGLGYASGYYGPGVAAPAVGVAPDAGYPDVGAANVAPATQEQPPQDNAAHLQLIVPDGAEVYFDGAKTSKTGKVREFVSPTLEPGKSYTYVIEVRTTGPDGKPVADRRDIHVGANDWFMIDFTRPAPANSPTTRPGAGPVMPPASDK